MEVTGMGPRSRHLNPFKLLITILFAETDYIEWHSQVDVTVKLGPLSRSLGYPNYRTRDYLQYLEHSYYISNLVMTYGKARFSINLPQRVIDE